MSKLMEWIRKQKAARVQLYLGAFALMVLWVLKVVDQTGFDLEDMRVAIYEIGVKSVGLMASIAAAAIFMQLTGMDLANSERRRLQLMLLDPTIPRDVRLSILTILAAEAFCWFLSLGVALCTLFVLQG